MEGVPIIDCSLGEEELLPILHRACSEFGFFYISNHGIESAVLEKALEETKRFFHLPQKEKEALNAKNSPFFRGYTPFNEERPDPKNQVVGDTKEGFYIGSEPGKEGEDTAPFIGPNQWPSELSLEGWRAFMEGYQKQLSSLAMRIVNLLGKAIAYCAEDESKQIPYDFSPHFTKPLAYLRLLHYNAETSVPSEGVFGCGAHTDYGMLTILLTDDVPALQIYPRGSNEASSPVSVDGDKWINVSPLQGTFIVNLGDMLQRWSNDRYKSTLHRVVNTSNQERYSIPFFFEPNFDCRVECIACCVPKGKKPNYPPTASGEYLIDRYNETHNDFVQ